MNIKKLVAIFAPIALQAMLPIPDYKDVFRGFYFQCEKRWGINVEVDIERCESLEECFRSYFFAFFSGAKMHGFDPRFVMRFLVDGFPGLNSVFLVVADLQFPVDKNCFNNSLVSVLGEIIREMPSDTKFLLPGCGDCQELVVLDNLFPSSHFYCVDTDKARLQSLSRMTVKYNIQQSRVSLYKADAAKEKIYERIADVGFVLIRHPEVFEGLSTGNVVNDDWQLIFGNCMTKLSMGGYFLLTSYFETEHDAMLDYFKGIGVDVISNGRNSHSYVLPETVAIEEYSKVFNDDHYSTRVSNGTQKRDNYFILLRKSGSFIDTCENTNKRNSG
jgi:hypothetical protein